MRVRNSKCIIAVFPSLVLDYFDRAIVFYASLDLMISWFCDKNSPDVALKSNRFAFRNFSFDLTICTNFLSYICHCFVHFSKMLEHRGAMLLWNFLKPFWMNFERFSNAMMLLLLLLMLIMIWRRWRSQIFTMLWINSKGTRYTQPLTETRSGMMFQELRGKALNKSFRLLGSIPSWYIVPNDV